MKTQSLKYAFGVIETEAMRIARQLVKNEIVATGHKISWISATEITKAASQILDEDAEVLRRAYLNIKERVSKCGSTKTKSPQG